MAGVNAYMENIQISTPGCNQELGQGEGHCFFVMNLQKTDILRKHTLFQDKKMSQIQKLAPCPKKNMYKRKVCHKSSSSGRGPGMTC